MNVNTFKYDIFVWVNIDKRVIRYVPVKIMVFLLKTDAGYLYNDDMQTVIQYLSRLV